MAIGSSPIQQRSDAPAGFATTVELAFVSNVTAGKSIIVVATFSDSPSAPTVTDTLSNTYTRRACTNNAGTGVTTAIFDSIGIAGGACTVTAASNIGGVNLRSIRIYEWDGISSYVGTNTALTNGTTIVSGTVAPGGDGRLFFGAADGQATVAASGSFANLETPSTVLGDAYYIQPTASTIEATWTDGAGNGRGFLAVYAPAVSGPTIDTQPTAQTCTINNSADTTATFTCDFAEALDSALYEFEDSVGSGTYSAVSNGGIYAITTNLGTGTCTLAITPTTKTGITGRRVRISGTTASGTTVSDAVAITVYTGFQFTSSTTATTNGSGVATVTWTDDRPGSALGNGGFVKGVATSGTAVSRTSQRPT